MSATGTDGHLGRSETTLTTMLLQRSITTSSHNSSSWLTSQRKGGRRIHAAHSETVFTKRASGEADRASASLQSAVNKLSKDAPLTRTVRAGQGSPCPVRTSHTRAFGTRLQKASKVDAARYEVRLPRQEFETRVKRVPVASRACFPTDMSVGEGAPEELFLPHPFWTAFSAQLSLADIRAIVVYCSVSEVSRLHQ